MAGAQIKFLKQVIDKPIFVLKRDFNTNFKSGRRSSALGNAEVADIYICDIQEESIVINHGQKRSVNRIFVDIADSHDSMKAILNPYSKVGWILNDDLTICMICKNSLLGYISNDRHHCKACGNLVCQNCSDGRAVIKEIRDLGPLRICRLCDFGQEEVYLVPNHVTSLNPITPFNSPAPSPAAHHGDTALGGTPHSPTPAAKLFGAVDTSPPPAPAPSGGGGLAKLRAASKSVTIANSMMKDQQQRQAAQQAANTPPPAASSTQPVPIRGNQATAPTAVPTTPTEPDFETEMERRAHRLSRYGQMTTVTPTPGFVIKTKRLQNSIKIFVNICSHNSVPFKHEPNSSANGTVDPNKPIYMVVSPPIEYQNEKDNSYCVIYDCVVHPDEIYVCTLDATGNARHRLCAQSLELIHSTYQENLDPSYVILRLASNYKGRTNGDKLVIRAIYLPAIDAFYATPQVATIPIPEGGSSTSRSSFRESMSQKSNGNGNGSGKAPITPAPSSSTPPPAPQIKQPSSSSRNHTGTYTPTIPIPKAMLDNANAKQGLDRVMKAMVMPRDEINKLLTAKNFNRILDAMNIYEMKLSDLVITPSPGFIILAQRLKPLRKVYINLCHHPFLGIVSEQQVAIHEAITGGSGTLRRPSLSAFMAAALSKGGADVEDIPSPIPFIIGKVDNTYIDQNNNKGMIVDVVIPTSLYLLATSDVELKEGLAVEILQRLVALNVQLDSNYAILDNPRGYISSNNSTGKVVIDPVLNITEFEKSDFSVAFLGKIYKQGHRYKSWKERLCFFTESSLQYYDLKMIHQGEFPCEECVYEKVTNPSECSAPKNTFPFMLTNYSSGGEYLYCYSTDESFQEVFGMIVSLKLTHFHAIKSLINIPLMKRGFLKKQGHLIRNWKTRFFILNYGILTYYEKDGVESNGVVENAKGKVELQHATVVVMINDENGKPLSDDDHRVCISVDTGNKRASISGALMNGGEPVKESESSSGGKQAASGGNYKLILQMKSQQEKKEWFEAIRKHIEYAREYNVAE